VLPDGHPHAGATSLPLAALRDEDWVSLSDHTFPGRREFLRTACAAAGFEPRIVTETDTLNAMLGAVAAGDGVAIAPSHAGKLPHAGCVFIELRSPAPTVELMLVSPRGAQAPALHTLTRLLTARARKLGDG
jgi:DNA-binding transcriptional LysR family regulator